MRVSVCRLVTAILFVGIGLWADVSSALTVQNIACTSGELSVTIKIPTQAIAGDPRTFCRIDIVLTGQTNPLTIGQQILVQGLVDDSYWSSDSTFYSSTFSVTSQEAAAQRVQRSVDCTGDFMDNGWSSVAIYGFVDAYKGPVWSPDRCATNTLSVEVIGDEEPEVSDSAASAGQLGTGVTNKVAADPDWYAVTVNSQNALALTLAYDGGSGALDFQLTDSAGSQVASGSKTAEGAVINKTGLAAGTYKVKVAPQVSSDPNLYDLRVGGTSGGGGTCTGTGTEERDCGRCGTQSRTCNSGTWSGWTTCAGQGECEPGSTDVESCGTNKSRTMTCSESCEWEPGACVDGDGGGGGGGSNAGKVGLACDDNEPCGNLECIGLDNTDGMFQNGYCTMSPCSADSACGDSAALCGGLFGTHYCLKRCSDSTDCRTGYVCARFGNARACAPRCRDDQDCADNALPVCDDDSGLCLASAGADPQAWNGSRPNADGSLGGGALLEAGGGCVALDPSIWTVIFAAFLLSAHVTARRFAAKAAGDVVR